MMADVKAKDTPAPQATEWKKLGNALVYDTKQDGSSRVTKKGAKFFMGHGQLNIDGRTIEVSVSVYPGRAGSMSVYIEQPPDRKP